MEGAEGEGDGTGKMTGGTTTKGAEGGGEGTGRFFARGNLKYYHHSSSFD